MKTKATDAKLLQFLRETHLKIIHNAESYRKIAEEMELKEEVEAEKVVKGKNLKNEKR